MVDSADRERIGLARKEMFAMFQEEEMNGVHLLVFANKQDQKGAMSVVEVARELGLHSIKDRKWHICKASAIKGEGLTEGLDWLADTISGTEHVPTNTSSSSTTSSSSSDGSSNGNSGVATSADGEGGDDGDRGRAHNGTDSKSG